MSFREDPLVRSIPRDIVRDIVRSIAGLITVPVTYTEYFVSDGVGGFEQAYDSEAEQLFVKE